MTIIERAAKREAPVELEGRTYLFRKDEDGRYTANVDNAAHAKRLLEISGYTEIKKGVAQPAKEKTDTSEPDVDKSKLTPAAPTEPTDPVVPPATVGAANPALDKNANGDTTLDLQRDALAEEFFKLSGKKPHHALGADKLREAVEGMRKKADAKAGK